MSNEDSIRINSAVEEILCINELSTARRVLAQTTIKFAEVKLWQPAATTAIYTEPAEAAKRVYRKIVSYSLWHELECPEQAATLEAISRNEAYHAALTFRECILTAEELAPLQPVDFKSLPADIHKEELAITSSLHKKYGDTSPVAPDLA